MFPIVAAQLDSKQDYGVKLESDTVAQEFEKEPCRSSYPGVKGEIKEYSNSTVEHIP